DKNGNVITNFEDHIVHNHSGAEVKEWYALASYLKAMGTVDEVYEAPLGRKTIISDANPIELLKNPNKVTVITLGVALSFCALMVLVVMKVVRHNKKKKEKQL
ncbi:MAG: bifunctional metallophosphatase/5'-nucleotidase, partial [Oscillospiraceae bacterium]